MTNLEKYLSLLDKDAYDGLLLTSPVSRKYCAEFNVDEGVAIVTKKGCRYFTDSRYIETAEKNLKGFEVRMVGRDNGYIKQLNQAIEDFEVFTLGFEENCLTVAEFRSYEEKLNAKLVPCQQELDQFRLVKEEYELDRMEKQGESGAGKTALLQDVIRAAEQEHSALCEALEKELHYEVVPIRKLVSIQLECGLLVSDYLKDKEPIEHEGANV